MAGIIPLGHQVGLYDSALLGILQDCVKVPQFLDAVFSFLARRTDFYIIMKEEKAKMGFPQGVAESMVIQAYRKYEILTRKREAELMREEETKQLETLDGGTSLSQSKRNTNSSSTAAAVADTEEQIHDELPITIPSSSDSTAPPSADSNSAEKKEKKARKDAPILSKEKVNDWEKVSDIYNGAEMENYKWSQTITDLDVRLFIPEGTLAKHMKVDIRSDHLRVEIPKPPSQVLVDKDFLHKVKVEESMWTVDKERSLLTITLEKTKEIMWKSVFQGEEGIDLAKVDTTRDISEFDPECQAAIQRVTYDEHMKRLGKPTSGQAKAHDMLKKAWDAEGSPFKGTPFDPSKVQISGNWQ